MNHTLKYRTAFRYLLPLMLTAFMVVPAIAQDTKQQPAQSEMKTMHIKIVRELNGKVQVIDTVLNVADHPLFLRRLDGLKVDTATLRRFRTFRADTTAIRAARAIIYGRAEAGDTVYVRSLKRGRYSVLHPDSTGRVSIRGARIISDGEVVTIEGVKPRLLKGAKADSIRAYSIKRADRLKHISPTDIESIVIRKHGGCFNIDSVLMQAAKAMYKVVTDEKTGEKKFFKIDEQENEEEVKGEIVRFENGKATALIFHKTKVKEITAQDKQALRKAGAPVELEAKDELKVEDLSYYPNPNNGRFNLRFSPKSKDDITVRVMDSTGKEILADTVKQQEGEYSRQIDISKYGRGIFFLQVAQGKHYLTKKVLVQ